MRSKKGPIRKIYFPISALFLTAFIFLAVCEIAKAADVEKTIEISTESLTLFDPVTNAGFGMVVPDYRPGSNEQLQLKSKFPFADIAYKRFLWAELEPREGQYNFQALEKWIAFWKNRGFRVGFGVMSTTDGKQGTPLWVFKASVPGVVHMQGRQIDPVMWDDRYLDKLGNFVSALGERFNGGKDIEFLDIRSIGMWGEMHFGLGIKGMWTQDELYDNGLSEDKLTNAYFRQMEFYKKAFPYTNLFLNIAADQEKILKMAPYYKVFFLPKKNSDYQSLIHRRIVGKPFILPISAEIHKRAIVLGIGLRFDGLSMDELSSGMMSSYFREYCFPGGPAKCFYEFAKEEKDPGEIKRMFDRAISDHVSYININFQELKSMDNETADILHDAAKKIGYQFYLTNLVVRYPSVKLVNQPFNIKLIHTWVNKGNIASLEDYLLQFSLNDSSGNRVADAKVHPARPVSKWLPGENISLNTKLELPSNLKDDKYTLAVRMHDQAGKAIKIHLKPYDKNPLFCYCAAFKYSLGNNGEMDLRLENESD